MNIKKAKNHHFGSLKFYSESDRQWIGTKTVTFTVKRAEKSVGRLLKSGQTIELGKRTRKMKVFKKENLQGRNFFK